MKLPRWALRCLLPASLALACKAEPVGEHPPSPAVAPPSEAPSPSPSPNAEPKAAPAWFEVVSQAPGPELQDAEMRKAVEASGRPWKIRDLATGIDMVLVMPGEFLMGSAATEAGHRADEGPVHRVQISKPFYMGATELSQGSWEKMMGPSDHFFPGPELPVDISWKLAQDFMKRANEELPADAPPLRLPTEAEWEYASRAGRTTPFSFSAPAKGPERHAQMNFNDGDPERAQVVNGRLEVEWRTPPSPGCRMQTAPVGSLPPNPWGLHEMHGNLWEFTADKYKEDAYAGRGELSVDPLVRGEDLQGYTLRGGSWYDPASRCRSSSRDLGGPEVRSNRIGVRLARDVSALN